MFEKSSVQAGTFVLTGRRLQRGSLTRWVSAAGDAVRIESLTVSPRASANSKSPRSSLSSVRSVPSLPGARAPRAQAPGREAIAEAVERPLRARHVDVEHGRDVERQELRHQEAAHDRQAERAPRVRARPDAEPDRDRAEERGHRRHRDRPEPEQAPPVDGVRRGGARALGFEREVDHQYRVLVDYADQHY